MSEAANWQAIGAIGEVIGGIAVLVTLIYLAFQVRYSKQLLERNESVSLSNVYQARLDILAKRMELETKPEAMNAFEKYVSSGWDSLSQKEQRLLYQLALLEISHHDFNLYQEELGLLEQVDPEITRERIIASYPHWEIMGVPIRSRIKKFYHAYTTR